MVNFPFSRVAAVLVAAVLAGACDSNGKSDMNSVSAPSAFVATDGFGDPAPFVGASVAPAAIPLVWIADSSCPLSQPFATNFSLVIDQRGGADMFLSQVSFDFSERSGLVWPMVFSETGLSATFGTTLIAAGTSRHFQFTPRFGCGFAARPDRVGIRVQLRDRRGRVHEKSLSARLE